MVCINEKDNVVVIRCKCGIETVIIEKDEAGYFVSFLMDKYITEQNTVWSKIKDKIKMLWFVFAGKQYCLFDMFISEDDMSKIKEFL